MHGPLLQRSHSPSQFPTAMDQQPKRAACGRCRAQKLRCVYPNGASVLSDPYERCSRALVTCNYSPKLRMGRRPTKRRSSSVPQASTETIKPNSRVGATGQTDTISAQNYPDSLELDCPTGAEMDIDSSLAMSPITMTPDEPSSFQGSTPDSAFGRHI